jgi:hypothetical protein
MDSYCEWEWISEAVSAGTISSNQLYTMQFTQHLAPKGIVSREGYLFFKMDEIISLAEKFMSFCLLL